MKAQPKPSEIKLHTYQMGFGDCFLLTFLYPSGNGKRGFQRHVLIDCGSSAAPRNLSAGLLARAAKDIKNECGGRLDIVVATHRHLDHINGFETNKSGTAPGDVLRSCKPKQVLLPWTEDPKAAPDARHPVSEPGSKRARVRALSAMQGFARDVLAEATRLAGPKSLRRGLLGQLAFLGEVNLKNKSAVTNLLTMGKKPARYLYFGSPLDVSGILPGVKIRVLGPPTLDQSDEIMNERKEDKDQFWLRLGMAGKQQMASATPVLAGKSTSVDRPEARWIIPRLDSIRKEQLFELVRILDDAMNNTSLILLFEVGGKKLLFPGDAQIENWSYALKQAGENKKLRALLEDVHVYKVGHHGSRNATPKSLWDLFRNRGGGSKPNRLRTIVSTRSGKHGPESRGTEVPRRTLMDELKKKSDLFTTQSLTRKSEIKKTISIALR